MHEPPEQVQHELPVTEADEVQSVTRRPGDKVEGGWTLVSMDQKPPVVEAHEVTLPGHVEKLEGPIANIHAGVAHFLRLIPRENGEFEGSCGGCGGEWPCEGAVRIQVQRSEEAGNPPEVVYGALLEGYGERAANAYADARNLDVQALRELQAASVLGVDVDMLRQRMRRE